MLLSARSGQVLVRSLRLRPARDPTRPRPPITTSLPPPRPAPVLDWDLPPCGSCLLVVAWPVVGSPSARPSAPHVCHPMLLLLRLRRGAANCAYHLPTLLALALVQDCRIPRSTRSPTPIVRLRAIGLPGPHAYRAPQQQSVYHSQPHSILPLQNPIDHAYPRSIPKLTV